jgi:hypothetical protein
VALAHERVAEDQQLVGGDPRQVPEQVTPGVVLGAWFARRELLERVPCREDLKKHEDWDWLLRAGRTVTFVPEPLAIRHVDEGRPRASRSLDWRFGLAHIRECRELELVTPRAYASVWLLPREAARRGDRGPSTC